jgi:hypothetical protein
LNSRKARRDSNVQYQVKLVLTNSSSQALCQPIITSL